ncbi:MAG: hypothetical protein B0D87_03775, partial [Candidatus Sedimenticola endophacoides]
MDANRSLIDRLHRLNAIGIALSAERETPRLLERILDSARSLTNADGGTLYLVSHDARHLDFKILMTRSLGIHWNYDLNPGDQRFPPLPLFLEDGNPNHQLVATHAAGAHRTVNIPDLYAADGFDFSGTRAFDQRFGYRSRSFIAVPMANSDGDVIGVLQLINAIRGDDGETIPFSVNDQHLVESLASQAAVALTNQRFIDEQRELFESLVNMISEVIDERSPFTAGHSKRVSALTLLLAEAANSSSDADTHLPLSESDRYELEIAGRLHDCGKITTPDHLLNKSTKLDTRFDRIQVIGLRAELIRRDMQLAYLERRAGVDDADGALQQAHDRDMAALDNDLEFLRRIN